MTKEQQIAHFGTELPEKYRGYVLGRTPLWTKEYYEAVEKVAENYSYEIKDEKEVKAA